MEIHEPLPLNNQPTSDVIIVESKIHRLFVGFITLIIPFFSFLITFQYPIGPEWQKGTIDAYAELLIGGPASYYFYPFLLYSMTCMGLLLRNTEKYAQKFIIRIGIYLGIILALQYSFILFLSSYRGLVATSSLFLILPPSIWKWLNSNIKNWITQNKLLLLTGIGIILILVGFKFDYIQIIPFYLFISFLSVGPLWCLIIATNISVKLFKKYDHPWKHKSSHTLGLFSSGFSYITAWLFSITRALELYAELPPQPPSCYIATAAAKGNSALVNSSPLTTDSGKIIWINPQLRYLKAFEITLKTLAPKLHQRLRRLYDRFGSSFAKKITTQLHANLAYLCLKPFEWVIRIVLNSIIPNFDQFVRRFYTVMAT